MLCLNKKKGEEKAKKKPVEYGTLFLRYFEALPRDWRTDGPALLHTYIQPTYNLLTFAQLKKKEQQTKMWGNEEKKEEE